MNIASPKLKNLYLLSTASLYAFIMISLLENADTSISKVDSGRWKFVIRQSTHLNLYGGYMNISVHPVPGCTTPFSSVHVSRVLVDVVPTDIILPPFLFVSLIIFVLFTYINSPDHSHILQIVGYCRL